MQLTRLFVAVLLFTYAVSGQTSPKPAFKGLQDFPKIRDFTMNSAGTEAYFTIQSLLEEVTFIAVMKKSEGRWGAPEIAPFSGTHRDLEPSLAPDGLKLFFVSTRPVDPNENKPKDHDIWFVSRKSEHSEWSPPSNLGAPVNSSKQEFYPSVAANGNIYFTLEDTGVKPDIVMSKWNGNSYEEPQPLGGGINTEGDEFNAFVAPDESFLIFGGYRRKDGFGSADMYISLRGADGSWSQAKNLGGSVNSRFLDYCPFVDLREKVLYFTSRRSKIDSKSIDTIDRFKLAANGYSNGLSRLYKVSIAQWLYPRGKL